MRGFILSGCTKLEHVFTIHLRSYEKCIVKPCHCPFKYPNHISEKANNKVNVMIREMLLECYSIETVKNLSHEKESKHSIMLSIDSTTIKLKKKKKRRIIYQD